MSDRDRDHDPADDPDLDEAMISGYLDGELTQQDRQRVERLLDDSPYHADLADQLRQLKEATMSSSFTIPNDTQWDERPRTRLSRLASLAGWTLGAVWVVAFAAHLVWQAVDDEASSRFDDLLGVVPLVAVGLILLSTLLDRLATRSTDPYRKVMK